ncbi:MAG: hypothetical protein PUA73_01440 [Bacilli bacterium]|nr:hypothetical protein [Bacilli bacterium]
MREYLQNYINEIDKKIKMKQIETQDIENHQIKIKFFQHERLIHLLVTLFYGLFLLISTIISIKTPLFLIILYIILIILIFYVRHYFFLENKVQYLYKQYDEMIKLTKQENK